MNKIIIQEYNPIWETEFLKAQIFYKKLLTNIDCKIVHVGSTSIKGLWAKPILDIDIIVNNQNDCNKVIALLESVEYKHIGDLGIKGREVFSYSQNNKNINWMDHHLYLCLKDNENLHNHLLLQKHLLDNKKARDQYSELKIKLSNMYPYYIDAYTAGKTDLILQYLKAEGIDNAILKRIETINK